MPRPPACLAPALVIAALAVPVSAQPPDPPEPAYPLDTVAREAPPGDLTCPQVNLVDYRGDVVKYKPFVWVNADFKARLPAFESIVRDVGIEVYGRAPDRIVQLGGYGCRRMRDHAQWLSEHAFGNAIDVE